VKTVGTHGLTCLDGQDYAAIALSMQANAEATDAALKDINADLSSYTGRWWWQINNSVAINVSNVAGSTMPEGNIGANLFTDGSTSGTAIANGFPATSSFASNFNWPDGIYLVGSTIKYTVATPNSNTIRNLFIYQINRLNGSVSSGSTLSGDIYYSSEYERGAVGNDGSITTVGFFKVTDTDASQMVSFQAGFTHANTGSVIVIPAGAWKLWVMRMGSGLVV
jgi:hypothetical protein